MATGPEHFKSAEYFIERSATAEWGSAVEKHYLAAAQVHATLALTAATLDAGARPVVRGAQWAAVLKGEEIPPSESLRGFSTAAGLTSIGKDENVPLA